MKERVFDFIIVSSFLLLCYVPINFSQQQIQDVKQPPVKEIFLSDDGLITIDTFGINKFLISDTVRIYNEDGTMWYEYSYDRKHPLYFKKNLNINFIPFTFFEDLKPSFRIKASSPSWYKVIIDKKQTAKFIYKKDDFLVKVSFEKYIMNSSNIDFDIDKNPIRKSPNGKTLKILFDKTVFYIPLGIKGEWLLIGAFKDGERKKELDGWIQWKKEREILVKYDSLVY